MKRKKLDYHRLNPKEDRGEDINSERESLKKVEEASKRWKKKKKKT